ncbi:hypothetical protein EBBID32_10820 [Sphingobium indicum BiD32]|uniref:Uncharacterized protein n=1 Tax=Sphingobium indicum BiD32 TaxID=1301087 RepID=N1MJ09_9SPHN|nr:hypothetical protein EBBID32_10820 [Sphingobium indicum BiD32]
MYDEAASIGTLRSEISGLLLLLHRGDFIIVDGAALAL